MQRGKVYLSMGEEAIVQQLMEIYAISELRAIDEVIKQKRELALIHSLRGNLELSNQIMKELGEG